MADIYERLAHLQKLANAVLQKLEEETQSRKEAENQLEKLRKNLAESNHKLTLLERELEMAKVARGFSSADDDTGMAKAKINSLVREIDRCIAMLNE